MRFVFLIMLIAVFSFALVAQDTTLTPHRLSGKGFASGFSNASSVHDEGSIRLHGGMFIKFMPNGTFKGVVGPGQGGEKGVEGSYEIKNGKLTLLRAGRPWLKNGVLKYDSSNLKYPYALQFETDITSAAEEVLKLGYKQDWDNRLYDLGVKAPVGEITRIDGVEAVMLGNKKGITIDAVNVRKKPSASAEKVEFIGLVGDEMKHVTTSVLQKNTPITVLAKTPQKDKVGKWENHWYYIQFVDGLPDQNVYKAWAFGEFIRITEK